MGEFFKLKTFHGTLIAEERYTGEACSLAEADLGESFDALLGYVPAGWPHGFFLLSANDRPLRMPPMPVGTGVLAFGLARGDGDTASLYDPASGLWACATPSDKGDPARGGLVAGSRRLNDWERLTLIPISAVQVPAPVGSKAARLTAVLAAMQSAELLRRLKPIDAPLLQAAAQIAPAAWLEQLTKTLLASANARQALARLFPNDVMAQQSLPALAAWMEQQSAPPQTARKRFGWFGRKASPAAVPVIGSEFDHVSTDGLYGDYVSLPHSCVALARSTVAPRRDLCIVATARNEGLYLLEWLAYHYAVGVETVFLYTNDSDDGSDELLDCLVKAGAVRWTRNHVPVGGSAQSKAYGHALGVQPDVLDYAWALVVDLDEYLVVNPALFSSAPAFLRWHEGNQCDAIALNWVTHGSSGAARWTDEFIGHRFPHPLEDAHALIKTVFRPRAFMHSTPHYPQTWRNKPFTFRSANSAPHDPLDGNRALSAKPNADFAWVNHYLFRSTEEFLCKWSRNRGDAPTIAQPTTAVLEAGVVQHFMWQFNQRRPARHDPLAAAPGFADQFARLKGLPGVERAWASIQQLHANRVRTILPMFADSAAIRDAGDAGRAMMATLER